MEAVASSYALPSFIPDAMEDSNRILHNIQHDRVERESVEDPPEETE
jgi:hypothetical protein